MELKRLFSATDEEFGDVWDIYRESFPADGQRSLEAQIRLFSDNRYSLNAILDDKVAGLVGEWNCGFRFIEHLAVRKDRRRGGLASEVLRSFMDGQNLVVELPKDSGAIPMYEKLGFYLNRFDYLQPVPKNKKPVKLFLLTYPLPLKQTEFESVRLKIHQAVYDLDDPFIDESEDRKKKSWFLF